MTESGKVLVATALSVLAHVSFFTALAAWSAPVLAPVDKEPEKPLEVAFQPAPEMPPQPETSAVPAEPAPEPPVSAHPAQRMQLDPENLKKSETAPENPVAIAAHHSHATANTPAPTPEVVPPTPTPDPALALSSPKPVPADPQPTPEEVGIDALGNYGKAVGDAIGQRWEIHRKTLPVGEVRIKFAIDAQGRVSELQVLSNTANAANALFAERAVKEAQIPPIPPERLAQLPGGRIEIVYSFTSY